MEIFRELAVKIKGLEESEGSGCIYESNNGEGIKYVLTAQHCLTNDPKKREFSNEELRNIKILDNADNELLIVSINVPEDCSLDFAVIEVRTSITYSNVTILLPKSNMNFTYFGFPDYLKRDCNSGEPMKGSILEVLSDGYITIQNAPGHLADGEGDAKDNTVGFSGSGMYVITETGAKLIGLVVRLRGTKGIHGRLQGISIDVINNFLKDRSLNQLIPYALSKFDIYLEEILEEQEEVVKRTIEKRFANNILNINPIFILEKLKHKLFLPYDSNGDVMNVKLWEGWLRLIIYISVYKDIAIDCNNINEHICLEENGGANTRLYYSEAKRMATFVRELYTDAYPDMKNNDLVFVNSQSIKGPKAPSQDMIHNLVLKIDEVMYHQHGIDIYSDTEYKKAKIIHIDHILDELETELIKIMASEKSSRKIEDMFLGHLSNLFAEYNNIQELKGDVGKVEVDN
ncbi:hypothetical protein PDN58_04690 [Bacillus cereus]|nr:hypothetical protein [Bacillus cereus]MDA2053230.1 hypothetical protein [Bacillus cereus]